MVIVIILSDEAIKYVSLISQKSGQGQTYRQIDEIKRKELRWKGKKPLLEFISEHGREPNG